MEIVFLAVGRLKKPEQQLCDRYLKRISGMARSSGFGRCSTLVVNEGRGSSSQKRREMEADLLMKKIPAKAVLVALDECGKGVNSSDFSARLAELRDRGAARLVFAIGGPDGHGERLLQRADLCLSLSPLTLPHGLARVVLCEQVYRALTLLGNHPYHRA